LVGKRSIPKNSNAPWGREFDYMEIEVDSTEKEKMQIMVTSDVKDKYGDYILCEDDPEEYEDFSIKTMVKQE